MDTCRQALVYGHRRVRNAALTHSSSATRRHRRRRVVCLAIHLPTQPKRSLSSASHHSHSMFCLRSIYEIKLLCHCHRENIISILSILRLPSLHDFTEVYPVQELMETDLHRVIRTQELSDDHCQYFIYQVCTLLAQFDPYSPSADFASARGASLSRRASSQSQAIQSALNTSCNFKVCSLQFSIFSSHHPAALRLWTRSLAPAMLTTAAPSLGPGAGTHTVHHTFMTEYVTTRWYHAPEVTHLQGIHPHH